MQKLLAQLAIVESFSILAVDGDQIRYRVESHGGAERLRRALVFNGLLEEQLVESGTLLSGMPEATLEFYFQADQTRP